MLSSNATTGAPRTIALGLYEGRFEGYAAVAYHPLWPAYASATFEVTPGVGQLHKWQLDPSVWRLTIDPGQREKDFFFAFSTGGTEPEDAILLACVGTASQPAVITGGSNPNGKFTGTFGIASNGMAFADSSLVPTPNAWQPSGGDKYPAVRLQASIVQPPRWAHVRNQPGCCHSPGAAVVSACAPSGPNLHRPPGPACPAPPTMLQHAGRGGHNHDPRQHPQRLWRDHAPAAG